MCKVRSIYAFVTSHIVLHVRRLSKSGLVRKNQFSLNFGDFGFRLGSIRRWLSGGCLPPCGGFTWNAGNMRAIIRECKGVGFTQFCAEVKKSATSTAEQEGSAARWWPPSTLQWTSIETRSTPVVRPISPEWSVHVMFRDIQLVSRSTRCRVCSLSTAMTCW